MKDMASSEEALKKKSPSGVQSDAGFTLLEIIISIILSAILGTILIQVISTNLYRSSDAVQLIRDSYDIGKTMEQMNRNYRYWLKNSPEAESLSVFKTTYVDGQPGVVGAETALIELTTGDQADGVESLRVTFENGGQFMQTLYTK